MSNDLIQLSKDLIKHGREDYIWFFVNALDVNPNHIWDGMRVMADSLRDNDKTCVYAGHGVSKTYSLARLALAFLFCYPPATVVTTAPTDTQVKDLLWREIREAHSNARIPLGGNLTTRMLDMQEQTGLRWFATGFSTRPDTVTREATAFQGYHNDHLLVIFDEAAGILPEIWKAAHYIGAPYKRWIAVGNPTSATGDFASCNKNPTWTKLNLSVLDTPNYKTGRMIIPGVYGRKYEQDVIDEFGKDSDEYKVRVLGQISKKAFPGAYYFDTFTWLEEQGKIGTGLFNPHYLVHTVCDPGYTTAWWWFQVLPTGLVSVIRYYEDSGRDMPYYADLLARFKQEYGYRYGQHFAPVDVDNNQYKIVDGDGLLEIARQAGINFDVLPYEPYRSVGIERTTRFLKSCRFDSEGCEIGIDRAKSYHQGINKRMSTDKMVVFTGLPEKDGSDHAADGLRYMSLAVNKVHNGESSSGAPRQTSLGIG